LAVLGDIFYYSNVWFLIYTAYCRKYGQWGW